MAESNVYVSRSNLPNAGEGLFLVKSVCKNTIIIEMKDYIVLDSDFSILRAPCPHDGIIHIISGNKNSRILDKEWFEKRPLWHFINHSKNPNIFMRKKLGQIQWISSRDIQHGSELLFNYDIEGPTSFEHEAKNVNFDKYCVCGGPDYGTPMIECEECKIWFHTSCIDISDQVFEQFENGSKTFSCDMHKSRVCLCRNRRQTQTTVPCQCGLVFHRECIFHAPKDTEMLNCIEHVHEKLLRDLYIKTRLYKNGYIIIRSAVNVLPETVARARYAANYKAGVIFNHKSRLKNDNKRLQAKFDVQQDTDLPGFSDISAILGLPAASGYEFVVLYSKAGCQSQPAHMDYKLSPNHDTTSYNISHGAVVALENGTKLDLWPSAHHFVGVSKPPRFPIDRKTVLLGPGDVCIFRGDCVHAGSSYDKDNIRIHCYIDIPGMTHPKNFFFKWQNVIPQGTLN